MKRKLIMSMLGALPQHELEILKEEYLIDIEVSKMKMENEWKDLPFRNRAGLQPIGPEVVSRKKNHSKPGGQFAKEVFKRRKKNKNKKTHRKK